MLTEVDTVYAALRNQFRVLDAQCYLACQEFRHPRATWQMEARREEVLKQTKKFEEAVFAFLEQLSKTEGAR